MYLSAIVHLKNKYPGGKVLATETSVDAYDKDGNHAVAIRKNGAGGWSDVSEEMGCSRKLCLSPIPKEARVFKLYGRDGSAPKIGLSEEHAERLPVAAEIAAEFEGRVPSVQTLLGKKDSEMRGKEQEVADFKWAEHKAKKAK